MASCCHALRMSALFVVAVAVDPPAYKIYAQGVNMPEAAAFHEKSGDLLIVGDPGNNDGANRSISIAVLPGGSPADTKFDSYQVIDDGSVVKYPGDIAFGKDSKGIAWVTDSSFEGRGIAKYERSDAGKWELGAKYELSRLDDGKWNCDKDRRTFQEPSAIAIGPNSEVYMTVVVVQYTWCLLKPLDRCCRAVSRSTSVLQLILPSNRFMHVTLKEVFSTKSLGDTDEFKDDYFHVRGLAAEANGDLLLTGYGDSGTYWGHTVWRWEKTTNKLSVVGGQATGQGGKSGDGGDATKANMALPWGVVSFPGRVLVSEAGNADIREIKDGIMTTPPWAPKQNKSAAARDFDMQNFRKLHQGSTPNSALLVVCGLSSNEGRVIEFEVPSASTPELELVV